MKQRRILSLVVAIATIFAVSVPATKVYAGDEVHGTYSIKENPASVKIDGLQVVGSTLKAQLIAHDGDDFNSTLSSNYRSYKWYRLTSKDSQNGTLIGENETYVISDSDIDQYIKVVVTFNGDTFEDVIGNIGKKSLSSASGVFNYGYWLNNSDGTKKYYENGKFVTGWKELDGVFYVFNSNGIMQTGWWRYDKHDYYLNSDGTMVTGWINIGGRLYYFYKNGAMAANTTVDGHKIDGNGVSIS